MKFRGVIFDFNGVLLWDDALQVESWKSMALNLRGPELTEEERALQMHGRPNAHVNPGLFIQARGCSNRSF